MASKPGFPRSVRVMGRDFKIVARPGLILEREAYGLCDYANHQILVDTSTPLVEVQDTLLHETVHAIDDLQSLGLTEEQVRGLATGLIAVLKDNPQFARFLLK